MNNILDLLQNKGISPKKASSTHGGEYHSPCPGCGGEDRFHVWPEQNDHAGSYWCRGCEKGGDAVQFLMDFEGLSFPEACARLGRELTDSRTLRSPKPPRRRPAFKPERHTSPEEVWKKKAADFVDWAHSHLLRNTEALAYLDARGISRETAVHFSLGWNQGEKGGDIYRPMESWGLPTEIKQDGKPRRLWIPVGLVIPYIVDGAVERIKIRRGGRHPLEFGPKYYVIPGSSMATMVIPQRPCDGGDFSFWMTQVVVEAELDALALWQAAGDLCGIVALGSSSVRPDAAAFELLEQSPEILIALDADNAGVKGWTWWRDTFPQAEYYPALDGKDPGEAYKAGVDLRAWIEAEFPPVARVRAPQGEKKKADECSRTAPAGPEPPESAPAPSGPVVELLGLLRASGARIVHDGENLRIVENPEWASVNPAGASRLSELAFSDAEVGLHIDRHPDRVITAGNLMQQEDRKKP